MLPDISIKANEHPAYNRMLVYFHLNNNSFFRFFGISRENYLALVGLFFAECDLYRFEAGLGEEHLDIVNALMQLPKLLFDDSLGFIQAVEGEGVDHTTVHINGYGDLR